MKKSTKKDFRSFVWYKKTVSKHLSNTALRILLVLITLAGVGIFLANIFIQNNSTRVADTSSAQAAIGRCTSSRIDRICWNGKEWFLLGANFAWDEYARDFGVEKGYANDPVKLEKARVVLDRIQNNGGKNVRVWLYSRDMYNPPPPAWQNLHFINGEFLPQLVLQRTVDDIRVFMEEAVKRDLYVTFVIFNDAYYEGGERQFNNSYIDTDDERAQLLNKLKFVVNRSNYSESVRRHILAWELINELQVPNQTVDYWAKFMQEFSAMIHANSEAHSTMSHGLDAIPNLRSFGDPGFDFFQPHHYYWFGDKKYPEKDNTLFNIKTDAARWKVDRPVVVGEIDLQPDSECTKGEYNVEIRCYTGDLDAYYVLNKLFDNGYAGVWPWDAKPVDHFDIDWADMRRFATEKAGIVGPSATGGTTPNNPPATQAPTNSGVLPQLRVSSNNRFLVKNDGSPFFWLGDTSWELFHRTTREEADMYLQNRQALKFNVIQAVAIAEQDGLGVANRYGQTPFVNKNPSQPNNEYFNHVDYVVNKANSMGMYVGMLPSWGSHVSDPSAVFNTTNARSFGEYLGRRYKDKAIIWILGGDRASNTAQAAVWNAMAEGIQVGEGTTDVLMTYHPPQGASGFNYFGNVSWMDFYMRQNGHCRTNNSYNVSRMNEDYNRSPTKPVIDGEPLYEDHPVCFDRTANGDSNDLDIRRHAYTDVFVGGFGHTYGHHSVWQMYQPGVNGIWPTNLPSNPMSWKDAINRPGGAQMQYLRNLMESRPFLTRIPDQGLVAAPGSSDRTIIGTRDSAGSYALVYFPYDSSSSLIRTTSLSGASIRAWWYSPRDGKTYNQSGQQSASPFTTFAKGQDQTFDPPGASNLDWILVLDDASRNFAAPGSVQNAGPNNPPTTQPPSPTQPSTTTPPSTSNNCTGRLDRICWRGKEYYVMGTNMPWISFGNDFGTNAINSNSSYINGLFSNMSRNGIHVMRWWMMAGNTAPTRFITRDSAGKPTGINPQLITDLRNLSTMARNNDVYLIPTIFAGPHDLPSNWIDNDEHRAALADVLSQLSLAFKDDDRIFTWQMFNEPEFNFDVVHDVRPDLVDYGYRRMNSAKIIDLASRFATTARQQGAIALHSVGSNELESLKHWKNAPFDYYTAHFYERWAQDNSTDKWNCPVCTGRDANAIRTRNGINKPVLIGETLIGQNGTASPDFVARYVDPNVKLQQLYDNRYAGFLTWSIDPAKSGTGDKLSTDYNAINNFKNKLISQNVLYGPRNVTSNPGPGTTPVGTPVNTPVSTPVSTPTNPTTPTGSVPGRIEAEQFNNTGNNVGYYDTTSANEGGQYLSNTSVDIERTSDPTGGAYNVGWVTAGEWLTYTFSARESGTYVIRPRVANTLGGGRFDIIINGNNLGEMVVPGTAGWQNFQTIQSPQFNLNSGNNSMRVNMKVNGWSNAVGNFNYFEFVKVSGSSQPSPTDAPNATLIPTNPNPGTGTLLKAINMNGPSLTVDGVLFQAEAQANVTYVAQPRRFDNQTVRLFDGTGGTRAQMIRSSIWGSGGSGYTYPDVRFNSIPAGSYNVYPYIWEDNYTETISIYIEGQQKQGGISSGSAGSWKKLGPYNVTINDGVLNVGFRGGNVNFSGVEIWKQ